MIIANNIYHVFNQGNNRQQIFFDPEDYQQFLSLVKSKIVPSADIISWCLMPNHFHFLINANEHSVQTIKIGSLDLQVLTNAFRILLSSYATYINKKYSRTGSLFRQRTKFQVTSFDSNYPTTVFHYIHQNPIRANLVSSFFEWPYSSWHEHSSRSYNYVTSDAKILNLLRVDWADFENESLFVVSEKFVERFKRK